VGKVAVGQAFLQVLRLSPVNIFPPGLNTHISCRGMYNRPDGGRSSIDIVSPHRYDQQKKGYGVLYL
jgi:hypothetical protein